MARPSQARILLVVGISILILGLSFVALPLYASGLECTINGVPRPSEECFQIFSPIGYGLLALGGLLLVGGFLRGRRREEEDIMGTARTRPLPRWVWVILSIGGGWASGIYLGQLSVEGVSIGNLGATIGFGVMSLLMAWGALSAD